jgi:hypothetical protein
MAEELNELRAAIQHELELARGGEGYEEAGVASEIVERLVAPMLAKAVMEEALRWRKIVEQWEQGHQNEVLPYTAALEEEIARLRAEVADLRAESENRLEVGDRLGWQLVEAREQLAKAEASRQASAEEAMRLEFRLEQVRADRQRRIEKGNRLRSALVDAFGFDQDPDEYPGDEEFIRLLAARPQCAVHPDGGE